MDNQHIEEFRKELKKTENLKEFQEIKIIADLMSGFIAELSQKNDKTIELLIDFMNRQSEVHEKMIQTMAEICKK